MSVEMCIKGRKAICAAVGENDKDFLELVEREGLPAWRRGDKGQWKALPDDLVKWMREQSKKYSPVL